MGFVDANADVDVLLLGLWLVVLGLLVCALWV